MSFASVSGGALLGIVMGLITGYYRGFWDMVVMRFADVQLALPLSYNWPLRSSPSWVAALFNVIFFAKSCRSGCSMRGWCALECWRP